MEGVGVRSERHALGEVRSAAMRRVGMEDGVVGIGGEARSVIVRVEMEGVGRARREAVRVRPRKPLAPVMRMFMFG